MNDEDGRGDAQADGGGTSIVADARGDGEGSSSDGALRILNLTSTTLKLTGGQPLSTETSSTTFIAIVTNEHGLDAIAGGQLMDEEGTTYVPFSVGADKGTYSATVDLALINQLRAITFYETGSRTFVAKFFDNLGNEATASVSLELACRDAQRGMMSVVEGACVDAASSGDACGPTLQPCAPGMACREGSCRALTLGNYQRTACTDAYSVSSATTCEHICANNATQSGLACERITSYAIPSCSSDERYESCTAPIHQGWYPYFYCECQAP